ncbi:hypothetical protein ACHAQH_007741 [Verticillium albo-atrum]
MSSPTPAILLVHGAWNQPVHYNLLTTALKESGYRVITPANVTAGSEETIIGKTPLDDVKVIQASIKPLLGAGDEIITVCHSYGGVPGTATVEGNTVEERAARGLKGGIKAVIYVAAFALPQRGLSLLDAVGGTFPDHFDVHKHYVGAGEDLAAAILAGASTDEPRPVLLKQSRASFETQAQFVAADVKVPKIYVLCENDGAVPPEAQLAMAQAAGAEVVRLTSGHSPYLNPRTVRELVQIIDKVAR